MEIKNQQYELSVNQARNRMYLKIIGFWKDPALVPDYVTHIKQAASELKQGFTILSDVTEMKTPPQSVTRIHEQAQKILVDAGLDRTAEILPQGDAIKAMAVDNYSRLSGMKKRIFAEKSEAEKWLDIPQ